jgi:hypothetical protein
MPRTSLAMLGLSSLVALSAAACGGKEAELSKRLDEAGDKVVDCKRENNDLKNQVSSLKKQLAQALANPGRIQLTDPEIIALVADIKGVPATDPNLLGKGALDPKAASRIVFQGAPALVQCYERALKKNQALQMQAGREVTLELTIRPQGTVDAVDVKPSLDESMTSCIRTAAVRWKFPVFEGEPVVVQQRVKLTPKT